MPKTPDEIKKGLECCMGDPEDYHCDRCPYQTEDCDDETCMLLLTDDALALIQQLEAQVPRWISVEERLPEGSVLAANFAPGTYGCKE